MRVRQASLSRAWLHRAAALALAAVVAGLAGLQVRGWDGTVNADGVSYLDLARQFARGDASPVANGYWSPLYPLLLGIAQRLAAFTGSNAREMPVVFAVNVMLFTVAALAVARLARVLALPSAGSLVPASTPALVARAAAAGALCIWMLLRMIGAATVTPDALLAAWLCLASADIAEAASRPPSVARHLRFGAVLALGYWTKAVFLPVALVAMVAYVLATPAAARRQATTRALAPLLLIALPLVFAQSWAQGRPSFGETGRLNYRWYVGQLPHAVPVHEPVADTRARVQRRDAAVVALETPPAGVLFTGAGAGTYSYWYDASRYEPREGAPFSLQAQLATIAFNAHWFRVTAGAFAMFALVATAAAATRGTVRARRLLVMLPALAMLALYAMTHPEGRLGAAAIACVMLALVNLVEVGPPGRRRTLLAVECVALLLLSVVALGRTAKRIPSGDPATRALVPTAQSLRAAGIPAGANVALIGSPFGQLWAHEGDVRIVASLLATDSTRGATEPSLRAVMAESAARGVPLDAVIWSGDLVRVSDAVSLAPRWWALRRPAAAAIPPAGPRTTPPIRRDARAAPAPRRAPDPAARP